MKTLHCSCISILILFSCSVSCSLPYRTTPPPDNTTAAGDTPTPCPPPPTPPEQWYAIRSTVSGLAVDGSYQPRMKVQHFTGKDSQLWKFDQATQPGAYYITNKASGKVLDVEPQNRGAYLRVRQGSGYQFWILNSNGHLWNVGKKESLIVYNQQFIPGYDMHVWPDSGQASMQFYLQKHG